MLTIGKIHRVTGKSVEGDEMIAMFDLDLDGISIAGCTLRRGAKSRLLMATPPRLLNPERMRALRFDSMARLRIADHAFAALERSLR